MSHLDNELIQEITELCFAKRVDFSTTWESVSVDFPDMLMVVYIRRDSASESLQSVIAKLKAL